VGERKISPTGPGAYLASCTAGAGGKEAGAWRCLPASSRGEVKERVELYLYFPYASIASHKETFTVFQPSEQLRVCNIFRINLVLTSTVQHCLTVCFRRLDYLIGY